MRRNVAFIERRCGFWREIMPDSGTFVTIEGIDGSGTTTVVDAVTDRIDQTVESAEPTTMWTGKVTREAFEKRDVTPLTRFYLFMADRVEHCEWVADQLSNGTTVVCDRGPDSTRCYQYHDADLSDSFIELNLSKMMSPDVTLWLDVDVDVAMERVEGADAFENRALQEKVARRYEFLHEKYDDRIHRIDANRPEYAVVADAEDAIRRYL